MTSPPLPLARRELSPPARSSPRDSAASAPPTPSTGLPSATVNGSASTSTPVSWCGRSGVSANAGGETWGGRTVLAVAVWVGTSAHDLLERLSQGSGFFGVELDDESPAALEWHAHHDAAAFLGDLERTVTRPRLHCRHPR